MTISFRPASACAYDLVALGEVMLRLDPGDGRVRTARQFRVWEGGGEYNVARGMRRCFGLRTAIVTALCDNDIGRLIEDLLPVSSARGRAVHPRQCTSIPRTNHGQTIKKA